MESLHDLTHLGFDLREIKIYRTLLKLGPASIRDIAARSNTNRGTAYEVLKTLLHKGIVAYFPKGKRKYFTAEDPRKFLEIAKERKSKLTDTIVRLEEEIIPELVAAKPEQSAAGVHYYEGYDGIALVLRDILNVVEQSKSKEYFVYSSKPVRKHLYRSFPDFTDQRILKGIYVKAIALGAGGREEQFSERKWISLEKRRIPSSYIAIYPPKCAIISLAEEAYPTAVIMDSAESSLALQLVFETLWALL